MTGPPGAGKSTITAALTRIYLDGGRTVGIIAVDPTSPFTGGALLGDRIRMTELSTEPGVFIRSMASRGSVGGLATATREAADLMDAAGYDIVILETLGVGQSELDIAASADTTAVVLVPESGDGIQAMKAGLMEVADLFVVNKSDRPGADRLETELRVMMAIRQGNALQGIPTHHHGVALERLARGNDPAGRGSRAGETRDPSLAGAAEESSEPAPWEVPVVRTTASTGEGVAALAEELERHGAWLRATGEIERRRADQRERRARDALVRRASRDAHRVWEEARDETRDALLEDGASPYAIADRLYRRLRDG